MEMPEVISATRIDRQSHSCRQYNQRTPPSEPTITANQDHNKANRHRDAGPVYNPAEDVPPELVSANQCSAEGGLSRLVISCLYGLYGQSAARKDRHQQPEDDHAHADHRQPVAAQGAQTPMPGGFGCV